VKTEITVRLPGATATPLEMFLRFIDCIKNDDRATQLTLLAEDCIWEFPFANDRPRRMEGRDAIARVMMPLWEEARRRGAKVTGCEYDAIAAVDPEVLVVEFTLQVEVAGSALALQFIDTLRVRGGEIIHMREYFSPQSRAEVARD
jgi:ketosteroid isomerase-like protein